jgi:hypothetical protein
MPWSNPNYIFFKKKLYAVMKCKYILNISGVFWFGDISVDFISNKDIHFSVWL